MLRRLLPAMVLVPLVATQALAGGGEAVINVRAKVEPAADAPGQPDPVRHVYQVAAIGDSLTDVRSHGGKYLAYLRERCPESRFDNYGKGGENVAQMRRRFARDVLGNPANRRTTKPRYTHVIVFGGVNDVLGDASAGRTTEKIVQDIGGMYEVARRSGIRVVGVTVSPWGGYTQFYNPRRAAATREVNDWILSQWHDGKIDYAIDAHSLLSCGDAERLCGSFEMRWIHDGLHFNQDAHARLGEALYEAVFSDCR